MTTLITRNEFATYEQIRQSGATNMFDVNKVVELSDGVLDRDACLFIMKNYQDLCEEFPGVVNL